MLLRQSLRCHPTLLRTRLFTPRPLAALHSSPCSKTILASPVDLPPVSISPDRVLYRGPLAKTFKRLKIFSLSSLSLCVTMVPLMFAIETNLPWTARAALATTAIGTSSVSTGLIAFAGRSYVTALRCAKSPVDDTVQQLEITTLSLLLQPRITRVFDPTFIVSTERPFAKWELAQLVLLPPNLRNTIPGQEETVAETCDAEGNVLGRWVVRWGEGGEGSCHEVGKMMRYFNVHEELLPRLRDEAGPPSSTAGPVSEGTVKA